MLCLPLCNVWIENPEGCNRRLPLRSLVLPRRGWQHVNSGTFRAVYDGTRNTASFDQQ